MPLDDALVDVAVCALVLNVMPEPIGALHEMARVTGPGGVIGACVWDYAGKMERMRHFCRVRMMQLEIGCELFRSTGEMREFADKIEKVANHLSRYPYRVPGTAQAESSGALTAVPAASVFKAPA